MVAPGPGFSGQIGFSDDALLADEDVPAVPDTVPGPVPEAVPPDGPEGSQEVPGLLGAEVPGTVPGGVPGTSASEGSAGAGNLPAIAFEDDPEAPSFTPLIDGLNRMKEEWARRMARPYGLIRTVVDPPDETLRDYIRWYRRHGWAKNGWLVPAGYVVNTIIGLPFGVVGKTLEWSGAGAKKLGQLMRKGTNRSTKAAITAGVIIFVIILRLISH